MNEFIIFKICKFAKYLRKRKLEKINKNCGN